LIPELGVTASFNYNIVKWNSLQIE
jgi:hypothetical protein